MSFYEEYDPETNKAIPNKVMPNQPSRNSFYDSYGVEEPQQQPRAGGTMPQPEQPSGSAIGAAGHGLVAGMGDTMMGSIDRPLAQLSQATGLPLNKIYDPGQWATSVLGGGTTPEQVDQRGFMADQTYSAQPSVQSNPQLAGTARNVGRYLPIAAVGAAGGISLLKNQLIKSLLMKGAEGAAWGGAATGAGMGLYNTVFKK